MSVTAEMLFNLQRFQILSLYSTSPDSNQSTDAYAYAWERGVYPVGSDHVSWHAPYGDHFRVSEEKVNELAVFLDGLWLEGKKITFYELESHYGVRNSLHSSANWDRPDLINACRYLYLLGWFDEGFWNGLVGHSNCPTEAKSILRPLKRSDLQVI